MKYKQEKAEVKEQRKKKSSRYGQSFTRSDGKSSYGQSFNKSNRKSSYGQPFDKSDRKNSKQELKRYCV